MHKKDMFWHPNDVNMKDMSCVQICTFNLFTHIDTLIYIAWDRSSSVTSTSCNKITRVALVSPDTIKHANVVKFVLFIEDVGTIQNKKWV